ncbi:MAG: FtsH protease activity modulator HflK [Deltaproteobacteria bacterium]|nr:MAG: FtsH protease activity modulator HflK [Deltaproteobacteria bacterium]
MNWDWDKLREQQKRQSGQRPGGGSPGGGGGTPPQLDELLGQFKKFRLPSGFLLIIVLTLLLLLGSSMVYTVGLDEVAIVQRFGKYVRTEQPGLNFKLPGGIEKRTNIKVKRVYKEEFGFRTEAAVNRSRRSRASDEDQVSLMLTGDLNVAVVPWIVQYRIKDPYNYMFKVSNLRQLLRDMAESSMRLVVGDRSINEVISKREEIAEEAKGLLQQELDLAETGLYVVTIEMKKTNVPGPVQDSFNEVNQAIQEKERMIYNAREDYNKAIPKARGDAERVVKQAEGYAQDRINRAKGDAARFISIYNEYVKAEDVTKRRMYLETMKDVFPRLGQKYVVDSDQQNFLPLLNMGRQGGGLNEN